MGTLTFIAAGVKHCRIYFYNVEKTGDMSKKSHLGEFEQVVLLAMLQLGEDASGGDIHEEIERRGRAPVALTAVYVTLTRMEEKGYVASRRAPADHRARKVFGVREPGREALRRARRQLDRFWEGVELGAGDAR